MTSMPQKGQVTLEAITEYCLCAQEEQASAPPSKARLRELLAPPTEWQPWHTLKSIVGALFWVQPDWVTVTQKPRIGSSSGHSSHLKYRVLPSGVISDEKWMPVRVMLNRSPEHKGEHLVLSVAGVDTNGWHMEGPHQVLMALPNGSITETDQLIEYNVKSEINLPYCPNDVTNSDINTVLSDDEIGFRLLLRPVTQSS